MYYIVIKNYGHLTTLEKCRKHSPAARVLYISLVFSNDHRVLSQCNARLRLLLNIAGVFNNNRLNYNIDIHCIKTKTNKVYQSSAPTHWLVHGHMTSNNETVSRQMPLAGNIAKTMTSNGKQFTVIREMLTAVAHDQGVA